MFATDNPNIKATYAPDFIETLERRTGESIDTLRIKSIDERRRSLEEKFNKPMEFKSYFPLVGRGTVLHDRTISREKVNSMVDALIEDDQPTFFVKLVNKLFRK